MNELEKRVACSHKFTHASTNQIQNVSHEVVSRATKQQEICGTENYGNNEKHIARYTCIM
jgi:hypothetical protein